MVVQVSKKALLAAACAATLGVGAQAAAVWTGGSGNVNVFDDANYDFSGSTISAIDPSPATVDDDVTYTGVNIIADDNNAFDLFLVNDGITVTLDGTSYTTAGTGGFTGVDDAGDLESFLNLVNGSSADLQFVSIGLTVNVDGTSSLNFRGGGDPINSQVEDLAINLAPGAQLTLPTVAEFTEQGADIVVNGVSFADDQSILVFNGNTATAVPEPGSLALLGLGGLALLRRRRG